MRNAPCNGSGVLNPMEKLRETNKNGTLTLSQLQRALSRIQQFSSSFELTPTKPAFMSLILITINYNHNQIECRHFKASKCLFFWQRATLFLPSCITDSVFHRCCQQHSANARRIGAPLTPACTKFNQLLWLPPAVDTSFTHLSLLQTKHYFL